MITNPQVLLLDEPLSALDEFLRLQMRGELRRMQRELGITFVHVTHTQLEAIAVADMVVVMEQGRIEQAGTSEEIYAVPNTEYVARFMGGQNVLTGAVQEVADGIARVAGPRGERFGVPLGNARVSTGQEIGFSVRRDRIAAQKTADGLGGAENAVVGAVFEIEYQGTYYKTTLKLEDETEFVAYVDDRAFRDSPLSIGDRVIARWDDSEGHLLKGDLGRGAEAEVHLYDDEA